MVNKEEIFRNLNAGMLHERSRVFKINLTKNLSFIRRFGGLANMTGKLKNRNVVVIGAGPGLEKNIHLLKKYRDRIDMVYIASDMALKPLLLNGIRPHYVITCETTPTGFFSGIETSDMHLLAFSCTSNSNLRNWNGTMSFYNWMMDGDYFNELWDIAGRDLGFVATGSIIVTQAVSIALGCGIRTLILVGNDLGFSDRYYASGTVSGERRYVASGRFNTYPSIDMTAVRVSRDYEIVRDGRVSYTNNQFLAAKMWLEDLFKGGQYPVVDSSYPGCSGAGIIKMELADFFKRYYGTRKRRK